MTANLEANGRNSTPFELLSPTTRPSIGQPHNLAHTLHRNRASTMGNSKHDLRKAPRPSDKARDASDGSNTSSKRKRRADSLRHSNPDPSSPCIGTLLPGDSAVRPLKKVKHSISSHQHASPSDWHFDIVSGGAPSSSHVDHNDTWPTEEDDGNLSAFIREWKPNPFTGVLCWQIAILDEESFSTPDYEKKFQKRSMLIRKRDGRDICPKRRPNRDEMNEIELQELSRSVGILLGALNDIGGPNF